MKNKITLCFAVLTIVFGQACSEDSQNETSEIYEEYDSFTGESETKVKTDGKFLCDFKWTPGPKNWNYKNESGDNFVDENDKANEPWCLIPYEETTEFFITAKSDESIKDYVCRDLEAQYSLKNEEIMDITAPIGDGEYTFPYKTHKQMMCVPIKEVIVTAKNPGLVYKDEKLYHIIEIEDLYSIEGHINLRLVKPINLKVMWEPIIYGERMKVSPDKIKYSWEMYMKKIGYYIDIITVPIMFPNTMENVKDNKLTLPAEKSVLGLNGNLANWFNGSVYNMNSELEYFEAEQDLSRIKQANYVIVTTSGYDFRYDAKAEFKGVNGYDPDGFNQCVSPNTAAKLLSMVSGSDISNIIYSLRLSYYDKKGEFISVGPNGVSGDILILAGEDTKSKCEKVAEVIYENNGSSANAFSIPNGYVLSHQNFSFVENPGRLLTSLLYSAILKIPNPIDSNNKLWLSSYSESTDIEQPMIYWRYDPTKNQQQQSIPLLLEFASIMQYLKGE